MKPIDKLATRLTDIHDLFDDMVSELYPIFRIKRYRLGKSFYLFGAHFVKYNEPKAYYKT